MRVVAAGFFRAGADADHGIINADDVAMRKTASAGGGVVTRLMKAPW
ncbi:MAG: hypothetical protein R2912_02720 [Eubacteriales bacterium]